MISGDNPPKYCRWCGTRMPAPGMHEGSFKSETDCELEAVKSKLDEQVRLREMAESFLRTAIEINEKNTSRLDILATYLSDHHGLDAADVITLYQAKDVERQAPISDEERERILWAYGPNGLAGGKDD
jgi:hypothetical protein